MAKQLLRLFVCSLLILSLAGCGSKYSADDFIGKTSAQIENEFGPFDCCGLPASEDGLYRNTACGYTIEEPRMGFLGTEPEILFFISFDENGIAFFCEEGYRPGG